MKRNNNRTNFPGFEDEYESYYFKYPEILGEYWRELSPVENLVLLYILRATIGFQKLEDYISLSQIANGIPNISKGTGLSISAIRNALKKLEMKGFIQVVRKPRRTSLIRLMLKRDVAEQGEEETLF